MILRYKFNYRSNALDSLLLLIPILENASQLDYPAYLVSVASIHAHKTALEEQP